MKDIFLPLKFTYYLSVYVAYLVRTVAMKDQALCTARSSLGSTHKELELSRSQNASLTQQLNDCTISTLEAASQSFQNILDQVEHFHHPLTVSKEQIWLNQAVIDRNIVSLRKYVCWGLQPIFLWYCLKVHCNKKVQKQYFFNEWNTFVTCLKCIFMFLSKWIWIFANLQGIPSILIGLHHFRSLAWSWSLQTYVVFPRSFLDGTSVVPDQRSAPHIKWTVIFCGANPPRHLEWLASRQGWTVISCGELIFLAGYTRRIWQLP